MVVHALTPARSLLPPRHGRQTAHARRSTKPSGRDANVISWLSQSANSDG